ncbi:MAG: ABC transporter substrate-binding protein, partial [Mesorhizobium sp.]
NPHLATFIDLYLDLARGQQVLNTDEIIARYRQGSKA